MMQSSYLDSLVCPRRKELEAGEGSLVFALPRLDEVDNLGISHLGFGGVGFGNGVAGRGHVALGWWDGAAIDDTMR